MESSDPLQVRLERFEIAIHPVTNAEFDAFLKVGGYEDDDYWPGRALAWRNGRIGEEATRRHVRKNIEKVVEAVGKSATPEQIKARFTSFNMATAKWYHERIVSSDDALESFLLETYPPASDVPFVKPRFWRSQNMPIRLTQVPPTCSGTALSPRSPVFGRVVSTGEFGWIHVPKPPLATL